MNSRERLLAVLGGRIPDRVPVSTYELVGFNLKSWENNSPSYAELMDCIRSNTDCVCMWDPGTDEIVLQSSYEADVEITEHRESNYCVRRWILHTSKGDLAQTVKVDPAVHTAWKTEHWCKSLDDVDKALSVPYEPLTYDMADLGRIRREVGDHGIIMSTLDDPLHLAGGLMEFGEYTIWAMTETEHFLNTVRIMHERNMENLKCSLDAGIVDLYRICGPEYATPPYLPPELFGKLVVPFVKEMVEMIHARGAKVRLHSHGRIGQVLDMIVETGADGTDPCEAPPDGDIELHEIKRRLRGRMSVWGNVQLKLLEHGSPEDIEAEVKKCMESAKEDGGYVIMPTASPINEPLAERTRDNYLVFIEKSLEYGGY